MSSESRDPGDAAVVRRLIEEGIDDSDWEAIEETAAEEVDVIEKDTTIPREAIVEQIQAQKDAMPDLSHEIHAIWDTGEVVVVHYTNHGTFENKLDIDGMGMDIEQEPNGEEITYSGVYIAEVEDGRITAWANYSEDLSAMRQLDVVSL